MAINYDLYGLRRHSDASKIRNMQYLQGIVDTNDISKVGLLWCKMFANL